MMTKKQINSAFNIQKRNFGNTVRIHKITEQRRDGFIFVFVNHGKDGVVARLEWLWDTDELPKSAIGWMDAHEALLGTLSKMVEKDSDGFIVK